MRCLDCGYDLKALSELRCPECGRAFDPNDPATYEVEGQSKASGLKRGIIICFCGYVVNFCVLYLANFTDSRDGTLPSEAFRLSRSALMAMLVLPIGTITVLITYELVTKMFRRWVR